MASEIRVNKINSRTGVGTITLSPTGVDFTGITTVATLKATTGIVTTLSATGNVTIGDKIIHDGDTDTAIRFPAADTVTVETSGSERLRIDSSGDYLFLGGTLRIKNDANDAQRGAIYGDASSLHINAGVNNLIAYSAGTERLRVTSGGNVRIGSSGAPSNKNTVTPLAHVDGSGVSGGFQVNRHTSVGGGGAQLIMSATRGSSITGHTILQDNDGIGSIVFAGSDGGEFVTGVEIQAVVDGTPGNDNLPAELIFKTNSGAAGPTERMRILSGGGLTFNGDTAAANALDDYEEGTWTPTFTGSTTNPVYSTSTVAGHYTKIGNNITCWALIIVSGVTSNGSGNWRISGFPYNSDGQLYSQYGIIGYNDVPTNEVNKIYMINSNNYAQIVPNGVTQSNETYSNAITTGYFGLTITYRTA